MFHAIVCRARMRGALCFVHYNSSKTSMKPPHVVLSCTVQLAFSVVWRVQKQTWSSFFLHGALSLLSYAIERLISSDRNQPPLDMFRWETWLCLQKMHRLYRSKKDGSITSSVSMVYIHKIMSSVDDADFIVYTSHEYEGIYEDELARYTSKE